MAAPEGTPRTPARAGRPPLEPGSVGLSIRGSVAPADIPGLCERVHALLEEGRSGVVVCDVGALVHPDAVAVDCLARLELTARRLGGRIALRRVSGDLAHLVAWMGLDEVLGCQGSVRQARREPEQRGGVQEEADPGDAP